MANPASPRPALAATPASLARLGRVARIVHPFPTLLSVAATAALALIAADGWPGTSEVVRLTAAMLCAQAAIGITNDIYDRELDAATKPWKPVASGLVAPVAAAVGAAAFAGMAVALAATFGAASVALVVLGTACGLAYDAGFKRSLASALPFMVAIPTLPLWVWASLDRWEDALLWVVPLGALAGLAVHLANTAPDVDEDAAHGVRGMAHALGERRALWLAWSAFALAMLMTGALAPVLDYDWRWYAPALAAGVVVAMAGFSLTAVRPRLAAQLAFPMVAVAAAGVSVGWLAAVT